MHIYLFLKIFIISYILLEYHFNNLNLLYNNTENIKILILLHLLYKMLLFFHLKNSIIH